MQLKYKFETARLPERSALEQFAEAAGTLIRGGPWLVPKLPFARTSQVVGGVLEATTPISQAENGETGSRIHVRLKAIEGPTGNLVENHYDAAGRLSGVHYLDGIFVKYARNAEGRLLSANTESNAKVMYQSSQEDNLELLTYPGGNKFAYEYDATGKLLKCRYPDGQCAQYKYGVKEQLSEIEVGRSSFLWKWGKEGRVAEITYRSPLAVHHLYGASKEIRCELIQDVTPQEAPVRSECPLGSWLYTPEGQLREMILSEGERFCITTGESTDVKHVWSLTGQTRYEFDKHGVLGAIWWPNGIRSMFYRMPGTHNVCCATPFGVALYQYDKHGSLEKVRIDNGQYTMFDYSGHGNVCRVTTQEGTLHLDYNGVRKLIRIRLAGVATADIVYGSYNQPVKLVLRKLGGNMFEAVQSFTRVLWNWTACQSILRLHDQDIAEV